MALSTKQRNALPRSAFAYHSGPRSKWRYPVPTKAQAKRAGISERERVKVHRAAKAYGARRSTMGSPSKINALVHKRGPLNPKRRRARSKRTRRRR